MWMIFARAPHSDAPHWLGRRILAALNAVIWPALWLLLIARTPVALGIVGHVAVAWAVWSGALRLDRAVFANHRYRFTTSRWGGVVIGVVAVGALLIVATIVA